MRNAESDIIQGLLQEYDIETAEDIREALKDLLGNTCKSQRSDNDDYHNGYKTKQVNSSYGSMEIEVPQDRKSTFEPQVVKKRQKDISGIDQTGGNFRVRKIFIRQSLSGDGQYLYQNYLRNHLVLLLFHCRFENHSSCF